MKVLHQVMVAVFTFSMGLAALSGDVMAADKKEAMMPADQAAVTQKVTQDAKTGMATATQDMKSGVATAAQDTKSSVTTAAKSARSNVATGAKAIPKDINLNTADKETLTLLPGVGPKKADAILAYRKANGNFKSIDELTKVKGFGEKTLVKLKPYLLAI